MSKKIQCPNCNSIKVFPGVNEGDGKCSQCHGTGLGSLLDQVVDRHSKCIRCNGSGICQSCSGAGIVEIIDHNDRFAPPRRREERITDYVGPSSADGYSCIAWLIGLVAAAIAMLFAILTVIVTMPIWIGAIAVSVITAYLYAAKRIRRITAPELADARLLQVQKKKRIKVKVAPEFMAAQIRWNPDLLIAGGSGILYALLLGGVLAVYNTDRIGKAMFGIAAVAGSFLAWKSGRKILELRLSEAVLTARQISASGPRNAAQVGFGLSCVAGCIILILIVAAVVNGPAPTRSPSAQLATPITTLTPRTIPRRSLGAEQRLQNVPLSPVPQPQSSRQTPQFAQTTPAAVPSPTAEEQFHVFIAASPNVAGSRLISTHDVSEFITRMMQLEKTQAIDAILANYASRVKYFDNGTVDQAFIRKDKSNYYSRWPIRSYEIAGNIYSTSLSQNLWEIRVPTKFRVVNDRGEWIDGDVLQILTVDSSNERWLITAEDGEVTRREKGTAATSANDSQPSSPSGSSQAIGGGVFRGKGIVYRIPDLKTLVGKELSNAWLYGEFAFERQSGDTAICRTAVTVLFVGKGATKVNIEFDRGFSVSDRILRSMRDPQLPLTYMLRASPNDPIRLLRVRHNRDGTLEAFTRSPIRLDMQ